MNEKPLVSVCMITYNHEKYIAQAIEGVLMQKTDFPVELVIGEDCSTDRTREIAMRYQEENPNRIRVLVRDSNLGMGRNFVDTLSQCNGRYLAICEGDDYWIDPFRLRQRIEFLEANSEYSGVCSSVKLLRQSSDTLEPQILHAELSAEEDITVERMLENFTLHTATFVCRRKCIDTMMYGDDDIVATDISVFLQCLDKGPVRFFNTPDTVYRVHGGGVTSDRQFAKFYKMIMDFLDVYDPYTDYRHIAHTNRKRRRLRFYSYLNDPKSNFFQKVFEIARYVFKYRREIDLLEFKNILGLAFPKIVSRISNGRRRLFGGAANISGPVGA